MSSKQEIINKIYFDRAGFGSKATTLKDAREKDKSIKMADVEDFLKRMLKLKESPVGIIASLHLTINTLTKLT